MELDDMTTDRRKFATGSVRDGIAGKPRLVMIPPAALERLGRRFADGAEKYEAWNAHRGQPYTVLADSLMRHLAAWLDCRDEEDHLAAVAWNAVMLIHAETEVARGTLPEHLDDRLPHRMVEWRDGAPESGDQGDEVPAVGLVSDIEPQS